MSYDRKLNFKAYSKVESLENFKSQEELDSYRNERLIKYSEHIKYFQNSSKFVDGLRVIEIGSGSSALLYAMEQRDLLIEGIGIEQSKTRYKFAQKWKRDWKFLKVKNINSNFVDFDLPSNAFDWFVVIDNTFSYLYPEDKDYPLILLKQARNCLKEDGFLVIELSNYILFMVENEKKNWIRLPESNPFRYSLYHRIYLPNDNLMKSESIYIQSDGKEKTKVELSYVYDSESLTKFLSDNKFKVTEIYSDFNLSPFKEEKSSKLIIIAKKS